MIKYIDKGTARQHLTNRLMESALNNIGIKADVDEVFRDIAENRLPVWIDELQTYDVVEVRHGRWEWNESIKTEDMDGWFIDEQGYVCSECGFIGVDNFNYCPNCGAKMDEVKE